MLVALRTRAVAYAAAGRHADAVARPARAREARRALAPRTRWCSATTCGSPGGRGKAMRCWRSTIRENPRFAQPLSRSPRCTSQQQAARRRGGDATRRCWRSSPTTRSAARPGRHRPDPGRRRQGRRGRTRGSWSSTPPTSRRSASSASCKHAGGQTDEAIALLRGRSSATRRTPRRCSTWRARSPRAGARPRRCRSSSARSPRARARRWRSTGWASRSRSATARAAAAFRESLRIDPAARIASTLRRPPRRRLIEPAPIPTVSVSSRASTVDSSPTRWRGVSSGTATVAESRDSCSVHGRRKHHRLDAAKRRGLEAAVASPGARENSANDRRRGQRPAIRAGGPAGREHLFDPRRGVRRHAEADAPAELAQSHASTQFGGSPQNGDCDVNGRSLQRGRAHHRACCRSGCHGRGAHQPRRRQLQLLDGLRHQDMGDLPPGKDQRRPPSGS